MFKRIMKVLVAAVAVASLASAADVSAATLSRTNISAKVNNSEYLIYDRDYVSNLSSSTYSSLIKRYGTVSNAVSSGALGSLYYGNYNSVYSTLYGSYLGYSDSTWKDILGKSEYKRLKKKYGSISKAIREGAVSGYSYSSLYDLSSRLYTTSGTSSLNYLYNTSTANSVLNNYVRSTSGSYVENNSVNALYNYLYR